MPTHFRFTLTSAATRILPSGSPVWLASSSPRTSPRRILKPNLTQFWNSWHMSLTQWFRSYFFNPFNRWMRSLKNIPAWFMILLGQVATMLLIGLWHGITLNFIFWGLWHGMGLFLQNRWSEFIRTRYSNLGQNTRLQPAITNRWYIAHLSFRRAGMGLLCVE